MAGPSTFSTIAKPASDVGVRSFNEWDPLEEVVVGTARGAVRSPYEPACAPLVAPGDPDRAFSGAPFSEEEIAQAEEQLDGFARLMERRGIVVRRPDPIDHATTIVTPDFAIAAGHAQTCPRDVLLVVGDELIEASMAQRSRSFEWRAYRTLLKHYFSLGARWTVAPRACMADDLYVSDYETTSAPYDFTGHPNLTEVEPVFDAACFARCGRDIFWQPDIVSNAFGAAWLQRHLGSGYRIHQLEFEDPFPEHIDATFVPLRPGLALVNPDRPAKHDGLKLLRDNGWETIDAQPSVRDVGVWAWGVSRWISMNILSLDASTVVIEEAEEPFGEMLAAHGFEVLTTPFDAVYRFGGSFHCCTLDVRRRGDLESYFPTLDR